MLKSFKPALSWMFGRVLNASPVGIYLLKVNNGNARTRCEMCSKLTVYTPEQRYWHRSGVFIVNFEHISHLVLMFLLLTLNMYLLAGSALENIDKYPLAYATRGCSERNFQVKDPELISQHVLYLHDHSKGFIILFFSF